VLLRELSADDPEFEEPELLTEISVGYLLRLSRDVNGLFSPGFFVGVFLTGVFLAGVLFASFASGRVDHSGMPQGLRTSMM
jgi:hypothetical protein